MSWRNKRRPLEQATQEIARHVQGIQDATSGAVTSIKDVAAAMRQIDEVTTAISCAVEQQGAATREISQNVQFAASGTQTLASNISTVNNAIAETNRSADHVRDASTQMSGAVERLVGAGVLRPPQKRRPRPPQERRRRS